MVYAVTTEMPIWNSFISNDWKDDCLQGTHNQIEAMIRETDQSAVTGNKKLRYACKHSGYTINTGTIWHGTQRWEKPK